jgi:hypothetical protein
MARASAIGENACLHGGLDGVALDIGYNTADPTTVGSNEVSGGSYARVAVAWGSPSSGSMANTGSLVSNIPTSTTITHFSLWNTATVSGTTGYAVGGALSASQTFATAGTFTVAIGALTIAAS